MAPYVAVLGGGIGGLSAAHELAERGFSVSVYEAKERFGGKARSIPVSEAAGDQEPLLGEHGFRFFPGFYHHVTDTMARIPYGRSGDRTVADNLVPTSQSFLAGLHDEGEVVSTETPSSVREWFGTFKPNLAGESLSGRETRHFAGRMLTLLSSCEARRNEELDRQSWWEFIDAEAMSDTYRRTLGYGTQLLVALRPQAGSARTVGRIYVQLLRGQLDPTMDAERVLNGPTSTTWIDPWTEYLDSLGVALHSESPVTAIHADRRRVTGVTVESGGGGKREIEADYYVAALPVEAMEPLLTEDLRRAAPSLARIDRLDTGWMSGIQFYLTEDLSLAHGHGIYLDSPWALTSISQRQFWSEYDIAEHGVPGVEGVLSVIASDWDTEGILHGKKARDCSPEEIKEEVWAQLKACLNRGDEQRLTDDMLHDWFLNPALERAGGNGTENGGEDADGASGVTNHEPLLVNTAGSLRYRPEAATEADNLVLASDYVRTETDLASMEGANEAARRATNAIIERSGVHASHCELWGLEEPGVFAPLKAQDRVRYRLGRTHPGDVVGRASASGSVASVLTGILGR